MNEPVPNDARDLRSPVDSTLPHSARVWNYWLGGKDHYAVDRKAGDEMLAMAPALVRSAREDRLFLIRSVQLLAGELGIRQFLDIGTGLPTADNTHEVAQRAAPDARVVYVDNDPLVLAHARALLTSTPEGATAYIDADVHDPQEILRIAAHTLDLTRPVAVTMLGIVNHMPDIEEARAVIRRLMDAVPSGSYLVISHPTTEVDTEAMRQVADHWNSRGSSPLVIRSAAEVETLFDGLELLEPGVVSCPRWRPAPAETPQVGTRVDVAHYCGVARKP
ncbi:SAM-dependent methyltransferase [Streptomyces sp. MAR4 CNX-425]|uniref:SAM-dependent methyltransferase n=1 Tax=Streptomyces sp. MAR4 CNX-425 TaxID=3406343 RepID=UPI003B50E922